MDEMITTTPKKSTVLQEQAAAEAVHARHMRIIRIVAAVLGLIVLAVGIWFAVKYFFPATLTPEETLTALEASSEPVTANDQERSDWLKGSETPAPTEVSTEEQLNILNALNN